MSRKISYPAVSIKPITAPEISEDAARAEQTWKNIIFLPFNKYWQIFLVSTIVANTLLILFQLTFDREDVVVLTVPFYFFESVYAINTIAIISHR